MRIWIDICNAPHVNFFKPLIADWTAAGHDVVVTARDLSNTLPLLERQRIEHEVIGRHYGKNLLAKALGFPVRCWQLWQHLRRKSVDIAISQSSYYSPVVARMLGCPCIYTNDNEFAWGNYTGFLLADRILLPEPLDSWVSRRFFRSKVHFYPGVKEGIYLHDLREPTSPEPIRRGPRRIVFRPEPWTAQYLRASKDSSLRLLTDLARDYDVVVLPRGARQAAFFRRLEGFGVRVLDAALPFEEVAGMCDAFIGAGGLMCRELAFLGLPTISIYRGRLLAVDRFLIEQGVLRHASDPSPESIGAQLVSLGVTPRLDSLRERGHRAYEMMRSSVEPQWSAGAPVVDLVSKEERRRPFGPFEEV